jgi:hypothetical protein
MDKPRRYQIIVWGNITLDKKEWFEDFSIFQLDVEIFQLVGQVIDQSDLHGKLDRIRDLGLPLISIQSLPDMSD